MELNYPLEIKSNKQLNPGHFWAIPLKSGKFACGRVIQIMPKGIIGSSKSFLAGLMDWYGDELPNEESIKGRKVIVQGNAHIKTIHETGKYILGYRPLELDGIQPQIFISENIYGPEIKLMKGYEILHSATEEDVKKYPVFPTWGYKVIYLLAEQYFGHKS